jgi:hypothetical protein
MANPMSGGPEPPRLMLFWEPWDPATLVGAPVEKLVDSAARLDEITVPTDAEAVTSVVIRCVRSRSSRCADAARSRG